MKTFVAFQFEMQPHAGQTSRECLTAVRGEMTEWLRGIFRARGVHDLQLPFDGSTIAPHKGHQIRSHDRDSASHRSAVVEWEFSEPREQATIWQFSGVVACDARVVQVALGVGVRWRTFALRPLNMDLQNANPLSAIAGLRDKLLLGWKCHIEGEVVPTRAQLLRKNHIDAFVREVLLNPKRVLPVFLFSLDGQLQINTESLHSLQSHVMGLAHVGAVLDQPAAERIAKLLGHGFYVRDAVLGLYWPGLRQEGLPQGHHYWTLEQLQQSTKGSSLSHLLMNMMAPASAEGFLLGRVICAAYAAVGRQRGEEQRSEPVAAERLAATETELQQARQAQQKAQREAQTAQRHVQAMLDELADLRAQLAALRAASPATARADEDELASELERAWDENKRLRTDWETARRQLAELETDFRNYLDSSVLLWETRDAADADVPSVPAGGGRSFATVADALRSAADEFVDVLVIWEDAEHAAEESLFTSPVKVFQALQAIAEVGRAYFKARNGGLPLGPVDRAFLNRVPFKYTCFESQTTLSLFGADRVFHHRGQSQQMQRHLTLGGGTTNNCLQIYFEFDNPTQRVLIGYCGRHLPYARQRT